MATGKKSTRKAAKKKVTKKRAPAKKPARRRRGSPDGGTTVIVEPGGGNALVAAPLDWSIDYHPAAPSDPNTTIIGGWATTPLKSLKADLLVGTTVVCNVAVTRVTFDIDLNGNRRTVLFEQHKPGRWRFTVGGAILHGSARAKPRWNADLISPLWAGTAIQAEAKIASSAMQQAALTLVPAVRVEWKFA